MNDINEEELGKFLQEGYKNLSKTHYDEAIACFTKVIKLTENNSSYIKCCMMTYYNRGLAYIIMPKGSMT